MTPMRFWVIGPLVGALAAGCGGNGQNPYVFDIGNDDGGPMFQSDAGVPGALDAHIEENHVTVTFVTLSCAGPCADVVAVATGGQAPYTYEWDDGSTTAARRVCPTSSTTYQVKATDTGTSGELARPAETVEVPLKANVLACPDGGTIVPADGGVPGCGGANTVCWASWAAYSVGTPGTATGTIATPSGNVDVTYSGEVAIQSTLGAGINWFTPVSTYTCATVTDPPGAGSVFQVGGTALVDTLTFSRPLTNPVFAIVSLGDSISSENGVYQFGAYGEAFTILRDGPGSMAGSGILTDVDGGLVGDDGDGLVQLMGTYTTIRWTDPIAESGGGHAFTIGVPAP
jgi:hypothetical protein